MGATGKLSGLPVATKQRFLSALENLPKSNRLPFPHPPGGVDILVCPPKPSEVEPPPLPPSPRWGTLSCLPLKTSRTRTASLSPILICLLTLAATTLAAPPTGFRNDGTGHYPAATPPTTWSPTQNIRWKSDVGPGASAPLLVDNRLFVTSEPDLLVCLDADTGKELWRKSHKLADYPAALKSKNPIRPNEYGDANPAPVSDGKSVFAFFGPGIVAAYALDGTQRWADWYDVKRTTQYGRTASPVLVNDRLLVHFGPLVCLDSATGKILWKNDAAKATYGTPAHTKLGDTDLVITPAGDAVRVTDGKLLASDLGRCMYASPVIQGRTVYFIDKSASAVELPELPGEQFEGKELWFVDLAGEFYASPIVHDDKIHTVNRSAEYFVLDAKTGKTLTRKTLDLPPAGRAESPNVYPSLCLAGQHLFITNDAGDTTLLDPTKNAPPQATNPLPPGSGSTPIFAGNKIYARSGKHLYCLSAP